jgi:hypothetical protein
MNVYKAEKCIALIAVPLIPLDTITYYRHSDRSDYRSFQTKAASLREPYGSSVVVGNTPCKRLLFNTLP